MNPITSKKTSLDLDIGDTRNIFRERYRRILVAGLLFIAAVYPGKLGEITRLSVFDAYTQVSVFVAATLLFFSVWNILSKLMSVKLWRKAAHGKFPLLAV